MLCYTDPRLLTRCHANSRTRSIAITCPIPTMMVHGALEKPLIKDYAIVLRMVDPKTEQMVVVAAGITVFGTAAVADFLTNPSEIKKLTAVAPPGWEKKNM